jgi:hypothetical protein
MPWLVLSYSLPAAERSSPRVTIWRRLKRLGVLPMPGGASVLPARDACVEAFQWLAQEIRQAEGEALIMRVDQFDGLSDAQVITRFQEVRGKDYAELDTQAAVLEQAITAQSGPDDYAQHHDALDRLRRRYADLARVDYFDCPDGARVAARLARIAHMLAGSLAPTSVPSVAATDYRNRRWVTRPRPHVDRLACAWLIRRFIDPDATIRYADVPEPDEVAFDMPDVAFGHQGDRCSFETMLQAFGLDDPGLCALAEIVHEIDLRDGRYVRPEIAGVDAILSGWRLADQPDIVLETQGIALFEGLYTACLHQPTNAPADR